VNQETASKLADALRDRYVVERELGRGGMATVYLARDLKHDRLVALKVLRPELAIALGSDRFLREIRLTAKLQHPHLLTVLDSGESADVLWYTMPFVEGETLRARLQRENQLPLDDALGIFRDVGAALAFAHRHGIMHRDVKPENILLKGGEALLADFGIARALAGAAGEDESLTGTGLALGTAAYMSPEQAAGERGVDGRADIYALGCVLYEMLGGEPPFTGHSAQAIIAKRFADPVPSVRRIRPQVPASVDGAIQQALARSPADRFATAEEFSRALAVSGTSGGAVPAARVALLFGVASAIVLALVYLVVQRLGLPTWVVHTAVVLLVVGFPIILVTGLHERRRTAARTTGDRPASSGSIARWLTWRRAIVGGALAFGGLAVLTGAYMAMRLLGIGPVGTLVASGVIKNREPVLLADFENRSADSMLGSSITEAFRVDLSQSPTVKLVEASSIRDVLSRMGNQEGSGFPAALARDVAEREGIKAIVTGRVDPVGNAYVLAANLVSTAEGRVLAAVRQTAEGDDELVKAIDRLSKQLRERIGESLVSIRKNPPLERVTTASLPALRKYSTALRLEADGRQEESIRLLQEAVALDSGFAMAWRKLAVVLGNSSGSESDQVAAATRAFSHRNRLPEVEANLAVGFYYQYVKYSPSEVIGAYRSILEIDHDNLVALNGLAVALLHQRQWSEAESLAVRASHLGHRPAFFWNAVQGQVAQGHFDDAQKTLQRFAERSPVSSSLQELRAEFAIAQADYEAAEKQFGQLLATYRHLPLSQMHVMFMLAQLSRLRGKVKEAEQYSRTLMEQRESNGLLGQYIEGALNVAMMDLDLRGQLKLAKATVASALARHPLEQLPALDRPYLQLAVFYTKAGDAEMAHRLLKEYETVTPEGIRRGNSFRHFAAASLAESEGRTRDAALEFRAWFDEAAFRCPMCGLYDLARLAEKRSQADSAITLYEQSLSIPSLRRLDNDAFNRAPALKRLGELYEAKGDRVKAADYYGRFVDLWKEADPELQPIVREVRVRLARLVGESGS
jgi:eukaryotic-like serine/threonine-protein kinase